MAGRQRRNRELHLGAGARAVVELGVLARSLRAANRTQQADGQQQPDGAHHVSRRLQMQRAQDMTVVKPAVGSTGCRER